MATEHDWMEVVRKLDQAKKVCSRMLRILSREGAAPRLSGFLFKAVIQAVLLFGAEPWVVTPHMGKSLGGFQTKVARRLNGKILRRAADGKWRYTLAAASREAVGFLKME